MYIFISAGPFVFPLLLFCCLRLAHPWGNVSGGVRPRPNTHSSTSKVKVLPSQNPFENTFSLGDVLLTSHCVSKGVRQNNCPELSFWSSYMYGGFNRPDSLEQLVSRSPPFVSAA